MSRWIRRLVPALSLAAAVPSGVRAQDASHAVTPVIITSASADVELKPDRATLVLTVESRAPTAARAGSETARKQRAVLDTLRGLRVADEQVMTARLEVTPEYSYPGRGEPPKLTGYVSRSSVRVTVLNIEQTGTLIDAALSKEASGVGSLQFGSSKADEARLKALELAVAKAKAEASTMARAAGGALGAMLELSSNAAQPMFQAPSLMAMSARVADAGVVQTPVSEGLLKISAFVNARWAFTPH
ncbi:MAG: SIMPL domain-containing protein [Gemmatimonadetes bacterium]|nr:SIMPL domain-containing protein [Gemmatimonadota bacterium]